MKDRRPLFTGPSDIDWLVADQARSGGVPRTFLPCCDDEDADLAIAMRSADTTIGAAVFIWRAIQRTVVVRATESADQKDVSEAA